MAIGGSNIAPPVHDFPVSDESAKHNPRRLNIIFITLADLPEGGGNTNRLKMLLSAVAECGHHVSLLNEHALGFAPREVLCPSGRIGSVEFEYVLGSIERGFGLASLGTKIRAVFALARAIRARHAANRIDVIWINQLSFYNTYPLTRLARSLGIATIQSYEDERPELVIPQRSLLSKMYGIDLRMADRYCAPMADAIVVISRYLEQKYGRGGVDSLRIHLIPTIVDCDYWDVGPEPETDVPTLLYAGSFAVQDEMRNLIAAFALLRNHGHRFRVVMLGSHRDPAIMDSIKETIRSWGLRDIVEMPGFVRQDVVRKFMGEANLLLNVRRDGIWSRSGLSTKLSEYLASGRAVVCTDLGDASLYLKHGENALLIPPTTTVEEIAAAVEQGLASAEFRRKIGQAGREVARRYFDISVAKLNLQTILESIAPVQRPALASVTR
jgi:glycosyltransferase involved in cell wall biosynthesis